VVIRASLETEHVDDLSGSSRNLGLPACCSANRSPDVRFPLSNTKADARGLMRDFCSPKMPMWRIMPSTFPRRFSASSDTFHMDKYRVEIRRVMADATSINQPLSLTPQMFRLLNEKCTWN